MYSLYEQVSDDIEKGQKDNGVWAKAYADASGDIQKQKAIYIELMVERLALAEEALQEHQAEEEIKEKDDSIWNWTPW